MLAFRSATRLAILVAATLLVAAAPVDASGALDCVKVHRFNAGNSIGVRASPGREIEFALESTEPGDGLGLVALISPTLCAGIGVPSLKSASFDPSAPVYLPLP